MSYYYNYYIGTQDTKTGKFDILGPFDKDGKLICIFWKSGSFASNLPEDMIEVPETKMTEDMKKTFSYTNYKDENEIGKVKYLPVEDIPGGSPYKEGFVLRKDVIEWDKDKEEYVSFEDCALLRLTAEQFSAFATNPNYKYKYEHYDEATDETREDEYTAGDFMFYRWISSDSKEFECWQIKNIVYNLYEHYNEKDKKIVLLETEG